MKCVLAYHRSLSFSDPSIEQAQKGYQLVLSGKTHEDPKAVTLAQDYVMHQILAWADQEQLVLQCHTGYQEGNANTLSNSEPSKLNSLILKYPRVRFDLFHIGYPYSGAFIALGKMFPNVYLNMAWSHILSPVAAKRALEECLLTVPVNKIFAFGGDCLFFDGVIGHLELARQNVAQVLGNYVDEGVLTEKKAKRIARQIFYESPKAFYR